MHDGTDANTIRDAGLAMLDAGLCVLPARPVEKRPAVSGWKEHQQRLPSRDEAGRMLSGAAGVCIVCGKVSGCLEMIDFDLGGEAFDAWASRVEEAQPGLLDRLVVERTPSGGRHVVYRCEAVVPGNMKLAERRVEVEASPVVQIAGKAFRPRQDGSRWVVDLCLIETRGEGGLFLCDPTPGYELEWRDFASVPTISSEDRDLLIGVARSLDEIEDEPVFTGGASSHEEGWTQRPGDAYSEGGDIASLLRRHGWTLARDGENQHWRRPGKEDGTSATLRDRVFYVFSSSASPFQPNRAYSPFAVFALLEHGGDWTAATADLLDQGFGEAAPQIDISGLLASHDERMAEQTPAKPNLPPVYSYLDLRREFPGMREPVIEGLLRRGETMNVIAPPKTGKSWLVMDLAYSVATGCDWLGFRIPKPRSVLMIDNELHGETLAHRLPKVVGQRVHRDGRCVDETEAALAQNLHVVSLRGRLMDLIRMGDLFSGLDRRFGLIVIDAWYRAMPADTDENDNGGMASLYNLIDRYAESMGSSFVLIHHTSKGVQAGKGVTDVGAGAGAQSRATDTHLVLRQHKEQGVVVLDAAVRSWAPIAPTCLVWDWPLWERDIEGRDPEDLDGVRRKREVAKTDGTAAKREKPRKEPWTPERFVASYFGPMPRSWKDDVGPRARLDGGPGQNKANDLFKTAAGDGLIVETEPGSGLWVAVTPKTEATL